MSRSWGVFVAGRLVNGFSTREAALAAAVGMPAAVVVALINGH